MIKGIGIDLVKNKRMFDLITKNEGRFESSFIKKILHEDEIIEYNSLINNNISDIHCKKKAQFLSSRWAIKEALVKATSNKSLIYSLVKIKKDYNNKPTLLIDYNNKNYIDNLENKINNKKLIDKNKLNLEIKQTLLKMEDLSKNNLFLISLSHEDEYTTAVVIMTSYI